MLRVKNLVKTYDTGQYSVEALKGISLCFRKHEFVSILGPSGCGKTTFLNIIGGLDRYTSGDLSISGISTKYFSDQHWDAYRNNSVGFVFQSYNLIPHLSILENVSLSLNLTGVQKSERIQRSKDALDRVGLKDQYDKLPSQMSGGQMQRVAIARALINKPDVILADEPTGALDSELSIQVLDILKEISEETLVIMVTHNKELADLYSTRIINMLDGETISDSNPYMLKDSIRKDLEELKALNLSKESENIMLAKMLFDLMESSNLEADSTVEIDAKETSFDDNLESNEQYSETRNGNLKSESIMDSSPNSVSGSVLEGSSIGLIEEIKNMMESNSNVMNDKGSVNEKPEKASKKFKIKKFGWKKRGKSQKNVVMPFKTTSMKYKSAISHSLKNLKSKKRRTILTTFAGSIGIISLAMVLAMSWGYDRYLQRMQKNVLASVPISTYEYTMEYEQFTKMFDGIEKNNLDEPIEYDSTIDIKKEETSEEINMLTKLFQSLGKNNLRYDYLEHIRNNLDHKYYDAMTVVYGTQFNIVSQRKSDDGSGMHFSDVSRVPSSTSALTIGTTVMGEQGLQSSEWHQLVGDEEYMTTYFDIVEGRYPKDKSEIVLVLNKQNEVNYSAFTSLGLDIYERDTEGKVVYEKDNDGNIKTRKEGDVDVPIPKVRKNITYKELVSHDLGTLKLIDNNEYYIEDGEKFRFVENVSKASDPAKYTVAQSEFMTMFEKPNSMELKIVGVLKPNPNNLTMGSVVGNHFCYTKELGEWVFDQATKSNIAKKQIELAEANGDILPYTIPEDENGEYFYKQAEIESVISNSGYPTRFEDGLGLKGLVNGLRATGELQRLGAIKHPKYISIYAKDFDSKAKVAECLNSFNDGKLPRDQVEHFDMSEMFIQNIKVVMKLMTIVLLALASISLIVSSIMIGIITGNSVYERTREIGMLRALGARKKDIARIFNTETGLIGLFSGILGIIIPYILIPLVNIGIKVRFGVTSLLVLNPWHAVVLVLLSLLLTFVAGIIPSQMAAKRDIIRSLATE